MAEVLSLRPTIHVRRDRVFGTRSYVETLPRRVNHPTEFFRNPEEAKRFAEKKGRSTGWPVIDETEAAHG